MKKTNTALCSAIVLILVLANEAHKHAASTPITQHWSGPQRHWSGGEDVAYSENSEVTNPPRLSLGVLDTKNSLLHLRNLQELDENDSGGSGGGSRRVPNLSAYHVRFEICQVEEDHHNGLCPEISDGLDRGESSDSDSDDSCIETRRYVVFRLCSNACLGSGIGATDSCCGGDDDGSSYGEYVADLGEYLEVVLAHYQEEQERYCNSCEEDCGNYDAYKPECMCRDDCEKIENMEENGYIDATEFIQCQMIYDGDNEGYFAGPVCSSDGGKIKIGVFLDEQCMQEVTYRDVEDYLVDVHGYQMKLSYALLKKSYTAREDEFISCQASKESAGETSAACQALHEMSAKCEPKESFLPQLSLNQHVQQDMVCGIITKLKRGPIVNNEEGASHLSGTIEGEDISRRTTRRQKILLLIASLGTFILAVYVILLRSREAKMNGKWSAASGDPNLAEIAGPNRFGGSNQYTPVVLAEPK